MINWNYFLAGLNIILAAAITYVAIRIYKK